MVIITRLVMIIIMRSVILLMMGITMRSVAGAEGARQRAAG